MKTAEFHRRLLETGSYSTPDPPVRRVSDHLFGRFSLWYYLRLVSIIRWGSRTAIDGTYPLIPWAVDGYGVMRVVEACGGKVSVSGAEHLKNLPRPPLLVANHMSMLETILLPAIVNTFYDLSVVIKESLTRYPLFGVIMRSVHPIIVTRANPREDLKSVLRKGTEALQAGRSVLIFPQATRSIPLMPDKFNSLGVKLARRAKVPLVPVALKTDFHGVGRIIRDAGRIDRRKPIHFAFGPPITVEGNERSAHQQVIDFIGKKLVSWGGEIIEPEESEDD